MREGVRRKRNAFVSLDIKLNKISVMISLPGSKYDGHDLHNKISMNILYSFRSSKTISTLESIVLFIFQEFILSFFFFGGVSDLTIIYL